jgi:hypothetical protein
MDILNRDFIWGSKKASICLILAFYAQIFPSTKSMDSIEIYSFI